MTIWTDASTRIIATAQGIARTDPTGKTSVVRFPAPPGAKRTDVPPPLEVFAVLNEEGTSALARRQGELLYVWSHGASASQLRKCDVGEEVFACVAAGPGRLVVTTRDPRNREQMVVRAARLEGNELVPGETVKLAGAQKLKFKSTLFKDDAGWPEDAVRDEEAAAEPPFDAKLLNVWMNDPASPTWRSRVELFANRFGVTVTSTYNGLVALLDATTLAPKLTVRVPCGRDEFEIFALPTATGVLVTLVANYRHTEYLFVDENGQVRGTRHKIGRDLAWGATSPGVAWTDDTVLINQTLTDEEIHTMSLPGLETKRFGKEPRMVVDAGTSPDGSVHVLALGQMAFEGPEHWKLSRWTRKGAKFVASELEMPVLRPVEPPRSAMVPTIRRIEGTPALGVVADSSTPWRSLPGQTVTIRMNVGNRGGPVSGVYVEIAGDAIEQGLVVPVETRIAAGGDPAAFGGKHTAPRAELAGLKFEAAPMPGDRKSGPMPPPVLHAIEITLRAVKAGQALMTVRVGPQGATGTAGSGMAGRSFVITPAT